MSDGDDNVNDEDLKKLSDPKITARGSFSALSTVSAFGQQENMDYRLCGSLKSIENVLQA